MSTTVTWPDAGTLRTAADAAARCAAEADRTGTLGEETVEALAAAGFASCFVPRRWGGAEAGFGAVTRAVAAIGEGCASAAWLASLWAYNGRFAAYLPDEGQEEVWAKGSDSRLVSSMVAAGVEAEPAAGGWELSGKWLYVSGVEFADWALVSSSLPREGDRSVRVFVVPRDCFAHDTTWSMVGMRATGSHTMVVEHAFVPEYRSFVWDDMRAGNLPAPAPNIHRAPLFSVNGLTFAAPMLGAARGALRLVGDQLAAGVSGPRAAARESHLIGFAHAAGDIDAAELLLTRVADTADRDRPVGVLAQRSHRDATLAVQILAGAVDRLYRITGTRGQASSHGMQRIWRDVNAAASHAALQFEPAALGYSRGLLAG